MKLQKIGGFGSIASVLIGAMAMVIIALVFPCLGLVGPSDRMDPIKGINAESASPITFVLFNLDLILWGMALRLRVHLPGRATLFSCGSGAGDACIS